LLKDYKSVIALMNSFYVSGKAFLFVINYDKTEGICILSDEIPSNQLRFAFHTQTNSKTPANKVHFSFKSIDYSDYQIKFNRLVNHILLGNSYLCNLTQPSVISINLSLEEIYECSYAPFKLYLKDAFVLFSPEAFVEIKNGDIFTYPMKGTISADKEENKEILLNDEKEDAEHNTIVDLLRNDLSIVATKVRVNKFKYLEKIETNRGPIWQMSSEISGAIKSKYLEHPGDLFDKILPAGSVTGAPKDKTIEILKEIEGYDRGYYTGVFGYCDGKTIQSAVMIRFIEQTPNGLIYKSGGGITSQSDVDKEYNELIQKIYVPVL
jgi:para-aminobenzoate synthetase component 1